MKSLNKIWCNALTIALISFSSIASAQTNLVPDDVEFQALKDLYTSTTGASWTNKTGWPATWPATATAAQMDAWYGVTVVNGDIKELVLATNNLTGTVPASIGTLTALTKLQLNANKLTGEIPVEITNLTNLTYLSLRSNQLTGTIPTNINALNQLTALVLDLNKLNGPVPEFTGMNELVTLDLGVNNITGTIPASIGLLPKLSLVDLHLNSFNGAVPHMQNSLLTSIDFSNNQLTAGMPATSALPNLVYLNLVSNKITTFPTAVLSFSKLENLYIYRNLMTGTIPPEIGAMTSLKYINLQENQLTGPIPPTFGNLTNLLTLTLYANQLTGPIPAELGALTSLTTFSVGTNNLTGTIPDFLRNFTSLTYLNLGVNQLTGEIPEWIGNLTELQTLYLNANKFTGSAPASLNNLNKLRQLYLHQNQLSGSLPELGALTFLENLYVHENYFSGNIPASWANLTNLLYLYAENNYLSGELPSSLVQNWTKLVTLRINSNQFSGAFPEGIGSCVKLTQIKADNNKFTSLPQAVLNIPSLAYLYFQNNHLTSIPDFTNYAYKANLNLYIQHNFISFDELELLYNTSGVTILKALAASPQKYFNQVTKISVPLGETLTIDAAPKGGYTSVVWEKKTGSTWTNINASNTEGTQQRYVIPNASTALNGTYRWTETSLRISNVTLRSGEITVDVVDPLSNGGSPTLYNGLITSVRWRTDKAHEAPGTDLEGMYLYTYDDKYQIKDARFAKVSWADAAHAYTTYELQGNQYRLTNMSYDPNGNIQTLSRFDKDGGRIHNFTYAYDNAAKSNQLTSVSGYVNSYTYNAIGQMVGEDKVEGDDQYVDYDVSGKVVTVYRDLAKTIKKVEYQYDAMGFRLAKISFPEPGSSSLPKTTWYIRDAGGKLISIYEQQDVPASTNNHAVIQKEVPLYASGKLGTYYPQQDGSTVYELTDHLGNVRALVRDNINIYTATMEDNQTADITNPRVQEMNYFQNLFETEDTWSVMNRTPETATVVPEPTRSALLFWNESGGPTSLEKSVGPAISLKVIPGDIVKLETYYRYEEHESFNRGNFSIALLSTALAGSFYQINAFEGLGFPQTTQALNTALVSGGFMSDNTDDSRPHAYLNYIVMDADRNAIKSDFERVKVEGEYPSNETHAYLSFDAPITMPANAAYIYAWVSNESENAKVWFDDFTLTHNTNFVAEATDYGVWGDVLRTSTADKKKESIKDKLFAQYLLNGNTSDTGPKVLNGTAVSGAVPTTDRNGVANQAYFFDGANDYIDVPNTKDDFAYIHNNGVFTISLFVKLNSLTARSVLVSNASSTASKGFLLMFETLAPYDRQLRFYLMNGVSGKAASEVLVGKPGAINDFNWHHVAVVGDGQTVRLYLDGVEDGYGAAITGYADGDATGSLALGATRHPNGTTPQIFLNGSLDEINIFNKALSSAEVRLLAQDATLAEVDEILQPEEKYRYQYQGQFAERDEETGWNHFEAREYDPVIGRWTSRDPANQFYSPYVGMGNEPVLSIDRDGRIVGTIIGGLIGGTISAIRGEGFWRGAAVGAAAGAVFDVVVATGGTGIPVLLAAGAASGLAGNAVDQYIDIRQGEQQQWDNGEFIVAGTVGMVLGPLGKWVGPPARRFMGKFFPGLLRKGTASAQKLLSGDKITSLETVISSEVLEAEIRQLEKAVSAETVGGKDIIHHFASNKHFSKYTAQFEAIAKKYGLDLDGAWNKVKISNIYHYSKHPEQYHELVLEGMRVADDVASGNVELFLRGFSEFVKKPILQSPNVVNKTGW